MKLLCKVFSVFLFRKQIYASIVSPSNSYVLKHYVGSYLLGWRWLQNSDWICNYWGRFECWYINCLWFLWYMVNLILQLDWSVFYYFLDWLYCSTGTGSEAGFDRVALLAIFFFHTKRDNMPSNQGKSIVAICILLFLLPYVFLCYSLLYWLMLIYFVHFVSPVYFNIILL